MKLPASSHAELRGLGCLYVVPTCAAPSGFYKETKMNSDQVKGAVKDAAGKVQQKTGEAIGSTEQQAKGLAKQVEGKTQKNVGDAKEVLKDAIDKA